MLNSVMKSQPSYEELQEKICRLERKTQELEELHEECKLRLEQYDLAMSFSGIGHFDWNIETNEIFYSKGWKSLLGYRDDEIKNEFSEWERLTHPDGAKASWSMLEDVLAGRLEYFELEFQMRHKDGRWLDILSRANAVYDENGKGVRVLGSHTDVSQQKKNRLALADSEKFFRALFERAGGYCLILEPTSDGVATILDANEAACQAHGYSRAEMVGMSITELDDLLGDEEVLERNPNHYRRDTPEF